MFSDQDGSFMKMALDEAKLSFNDNEVPVGAIIVKDNTVIGSGCGYKHYQRNFSC